VFGCSAEGAPWEAVGAGGNVVSPWAAFWTGLVSSAAEGGGTGSSFGSVGAAALPTAGSFAALLGAV
jgi:hypothetical protein